MGGTNRQLSPRRSILAGFPKDSGPFGFPGFRPGEARAPRAPGGRVDRSDAFSVVFPAFPERKLVGGTNRQLSPRRSVLARLPKDLKTFGFPRFSWGEEGLPEPLGDGWIGVLRFLWLLPLSPRRRSNRGKQRALYIRLLGSFPCPNCRKLPSNGPKAAIMLARYYPFGCKIWKEHIELVSRGRFVLGGA